MDYIAGLISYGWDFIYFEPDEYGWLKFDEKGVVMAYEGDEIWKKDLDSIRKTPPAL